MNGFLREYQQADHASVLSIFNQIISAGDAYYFETPFTAEDLNQYIQTSTLTNVCIQNERVVGGYMLNPNKPGRGSHVANGTYFVDQQYRGQGIGRQLGEHSLVQAKELGFLAIQFNAVVANNRAAVELWMRLGFQIVGTIPRAFRQPDGRYSDFYIMHRDL